MKTRVIKVEKMMENLVIIKKISKQTVKIEKTLAKGNFSKSVKSVYDVYAHHQS